MLDNQVPVDRSGRTKRGTLRRADPASETRSAATRILNELCLLGLTEAAISDALRKRRGASSIGELEARGAKPCSDDWIPAVRDGRIRRVLDMIDSEPSQSVRQLAHGIGLCPAHLQRLFKQQTGGGHLHELLGERRLQKAAELLIASEMAIKEIAFIVGFKHHSSFVRAFQREFGQTPIIYRKQHRAPK
jgi:AraC-like DNA-binding protein